METYDRICDTHTLHGAIEWGHRYRTSAARSGFKWGALVGYDTGCIDSWSHHWRPYLTYWRNGCPYGILPATSPTAATCALSGYDPASNGASAVSVSLSPKKVCFLLSGWRTYCTRWLCGGAPSAMSAKCFGRGRTLCMSLLPGIANHSYCWPQLFFLLAAAWVDPGRNALQSAEQRCRWCYGRIHQVGWKSFHDKNMQKGRSCKTTHKKVRRETIHRRDHDCKRGLRWSHTDSTYARETNATTWVDDGFGETKGSTCARAS